MRELKTQQKEVEHKVEHKPQRWHPKYFAKAQNTKDLAKKMRNEIVDMVYVRFLKSIKELYSQLPNESERLIYERNRKFDRSCCESMWNFTTPTFRMNLSCDPLSQYWIDYDFNNCPFEEEIMALFNDCGLIRYMTRLKSPDYPEYFNNLLESYPGNFHTLQPTKS
jgi:hypothetical protein